MAKAAYIGVPTVSSSLGNMPEGSIVQINENGTPADFYVAKHDYESGLNGAGRTLLVRKGKYEYRKWHSSNVNAYATSDIDAWLNGDYKALLSPAIQNAIGTTSFPYTVGNGNYTITNLSRSVFLISAYEVNVVSAGYFNSEGSVLPIASEIINSSDAFWTRTCYTKSAADAIYIDRGVLALHGGTTCSSTMGAVPCFTLPSDIGVFDGLITGASAGTADIAHKSKKMYLGIDSIAHKIKKAYIGVAGVARLFFKSGGAVSYYGQIANRSNTYTRTPASSPHHAFYAYNASPPTGAIDTYDINLTKGSTSMGTKRIALAGTCVGEYAIYAGGSPNSGISDVVETWNGSLTRGTATNLSQARTGAHGLIGKYHAFVACGNVNGTLVGKVDTYNEDLVRQNPSDVLGVTSSYAVPTGGAAGDYMIVCVRGTKTVTAYDASLTRFSPTARSITHTNMAGASNGKYCLFNSGNASATVEAYDSDLTLVQAPSLTVIKKQIQDNSSSVPSLGEFALFAGGNDDESGKEVEIYDDSLTKTVDISLPSAIRASNLARVGDFMVIAPSVVGGKSSQTAVYAYQYQ